MNKTQNSVAMKVACYANSKNNKCSIDPATLLIIVNIIVNVIRLLYTCFFTEDAVAKNLKAPGRLQKFLLYREVKKNFPISQRKAIYEGLLATSKNLSDKEVKDLISSA